MIFDFKIFPIMPLRQLNFDALSVPNYFMFIAKEKLHFSLSVVFREIGLSPESCSAICIPRASYL